jgi:hypothetical protein
MAKLIKPDGTEIDVLGTGEKGAITMEQMQAAVGGHASHTHLGRGKMALYDEDGVMKGLSVNPKGSALVGYEVVGNVLVVQTVGEEMV